MRTGESQALAQATNLRIRAKPVAISSDRLIFQIGSHSVHLTGRLPDLSKDEQEQLIVRLTALLAAHGLTFGEARLNGLPVAKAILRSNY